MNAVDLERVTLTVGGKVVLADISLAVAEGEFVGVLGPNGAGKTTLFKALLGLIAASAGTITVLGRPVRRGNPGIGYLPQVRTAPPAVALCGREFLASGLNGHRLGLPFLTKAAAREIDRSLEAVNAEVLARRRLNEMSGGERQRLLIAQALIGEPRLLLLDEPLMSLDPHQQKLIVDLVGQLSRERKLTVLFSGHELNQIVSAIDRVLYLGNGRAALGTIDEVMTPAVLSLLYGAPIDVVRAAGRVFVMSHGRDVEREHDHHHDAGL